jgi:hypothetical protein
MPIATKNNAIIIKDGKLAENCNCCGGWYCYDSRCSCPTSTITGITARITGTDYIRHSRHVAGDGKLWYVSSLGIGSALNGDHSFAKESEYSWKVTEQNNWINAGGCTSCIGNKLSMSALRFRNGVDVSEWRLQLCVYTTVVARYSPASSSPIYYSKGDTIPDSNFVFGGGNNQSAVRIILAAPQPNGGLLYAWNTVALCIFADVACEANGWKWTPTFPHTYEYQPIQAQTNFVNAGIGAPDAVDKEMGVASITVNEVIIEQ